MSDKVVVVDYGIGNVFSVCNALKNIGATPELTRDAKALLAADRLILPGVGAFARAMDALRDFGLVETLSAFRETGRPFMGICIGMQVLMDVSEEFGTHEGLGFVTGKVERIPDINQDGQKMRVPHISWASLHVPDGGNVDVWAGTPLEKVSPDNNSVYFVHSYHCTPANPDNVIAEIDYGGNRITAAIQDGNLFGLQFHPERSSRQGQAILNTFMNI